MTTYAIATSPTAEADIAAAFDHIAAEAPLNARRWLKGLSKLIDSLVVMPHRHGAAREAESCEGDLRQVVFKSHRIIYRIEKASRIVRVLHVRHAARMPATPDELAD